MRFNVNNEMNFHKNKISTARVEPSQTLVTFSVLLRLLEEIFSFMVINLVLIIHIPSLGQMYTHSKLVLHVRNEDNS